MSSAGTRILDQRLRCHSRRSPYSVNARRLGGSRRPGDRTSLEGPAHAFDCHQEVVILLFDQLHRVVEPSDSDDAIPATDVAVVEHQIARWLVVTDVADVRVISFWNALHGQQPGKFRDLLNLVEILE